MSLPYWILAIYLIGSALSMLRSYDLMIEKRDFVREELGKISEGSPEFSEKTILGMFWAMGMLHSLLWPVMVPYSFGKAVAKALKQRKK